MPQLPTIQPRGELGTLDLPGVGAGQILGRSVSRIGQIFQEAQDQQDSLEVKKQAVLLDTRLEELKEEIRAEPDFAKRDELYKQKALDYMAETTGQLQSRRVKQGLNQYFSLKFPRDALEVRAKTQQEWGEHRVAETEMLGDLIADRVVSTNDPEEAAKYRSIYNSQVTELSQGPFAPLTAVQAEKMISGFKEKIATRRAQRMIRQDAVGFLAAADQGKFKDLPEDMELRFREDARRKIEQEEASRERNFRKVQEIIVNEWHGFANQGLLGEAELQDALAGRHPYITPQKARTLKGINDNPPTGEGNEQVRAIMNEYYLSPRTLPHINATRAKLRALQGQLGKANILISQAANELQADTTTLENQGISREANEIARQNREIRQIQTDYEAGKTAISPFTQRLFGNHSAQDKAKIDAEYRRSGPDAARKLAESLAKGQKTKADTLPDSTKKVLELTR